MQLLTALREAGIPSSVATYEQFIEDPSEYVRRIVKRTLERCGDTVQGSRPTSGGDPTVKRAHGGLVGDYATNALEVVAHFATTVYSSWPDIAVNHSALHI